MTDRSTQRDHRHEKCIECFGCVFLTGVCGCFHWGSEMCYSRQSFGSQLFFFINCMKADK